MHTHMYTHTQQNNNNNKTVAYTAYIRLRAWMDTLGTVWRDMVDLGTLVPSGQDLPVGWECSCLDIYLVT